MRQPKERKLADISAIIIDKLPAPRRHTPHKKRPVKPPRKSLQRDPATEISTQTSMPWDHPLHDEALSEPELLQTKRQLDPPRRHNSGDLLEARSSRHASSRHDEAKFTRLVRSPTFDTRYPQPRSPEYRPPRSEGYPEQGSYPHQDRYRRQGAYPRQESCFRQDVYCRQDGYAADPAGPARGRIRMGTRDSREAPRPPHRPRSTGHIGQSPVNSLTSQPSMPSLPADFTNKQFKMLRFKKTGEDSLGIFIARTYSHGYLIAEMEPTGAIARFVDYSYYSGHPLS